MKISNKGIELIKSFEGCSLTAYKDPVGVYTIGYGHTSDVTPLMKISLTDAEDLLIKDLRKFEGYVNQLNLNLNQNQFDALVSFTFNCGYSNLKKLVKNRSLIQIGNAILLYNKAGGKVLNGLVRRRKAEHELFMSGNASDQNRKDLQIFLNNHGYRLVVDGIIGSKSMKALNEFLDSIGVRR